MKGLKKGYSQLASMIPPECPQWAEIEIFLFGKPFLAEENMRMIVKKVDGH